MPFLSKRSTNKPANYNVTYNHKMGSKRSDSMRVVATSEAEALGKVIAKLGSLVTITSTKLA